MMYLYPHGIKRALEIYRRESGRKINQEAYNMIADGLKAIQPPKKKEISLPNQQPFVIVKENRQSFPVQINIICDTTKNFC